MQIQEGRSSDKKLATLARSQLRPDCLPIHGCLDSLVNILRVARCSLREDLSGRWIHDRECLPRCGFDEFPVDEIQAAQLGCKSVWVEIGREGRGHRLLSLRICAGSMPSARRRTRWNSGFGGMPCRLQGGQACDEPSGAGRTKHDSAPGVVRAKLANVRPDFFQIGRLQPAMAVWPKKRDNPKYLSR